MATIDKFIAEFEQKFQANLQEVMPDPNSGAHYTRFFAYFAPRKKYSDWDLYCWLKPDAITVENLKSIESFARSFDGLTDIGILLTFANEHQRLPHHISRIDWLQILAFMPHEQRAPFLDLHIQGLTPKILADAYHKLKSDEFMRGIMLTVWRKYKNGNPGAPQMLEDFVLPSFPESLRARIKSDPIKFFQQQFKKGTYQRAARFLSK